MESMQLYPVKVELSKTEGAAGSKQHGCSPKPVAGW